VERLKKLKRKLIKALELMKEGDKEKFISAGMLLYEVIREIEEKEEKRGLSADLNKKAKEFAVFYIKKLWKDEPPEGKITSETSRRIYGEVIGKARNILRKLSLEEAKDLYLWWFNLDESRAKKELHYKFSTVLIPQKARTITDFLHKYPKIKALREEMEKPGGFYMSPESRRGTEYYLKQMKEEEDVLDEDDQLPW